MKTISREYLLTNDRQTESVYLKCENERSKYFNHIPKGTYVLNSMMSELDPGRFEPIDKDRKSYVIRLNSKAFMKGGKKVNNLIRLMFVKAGLWLNGIDHESQDAIDNEVRSLKIKGLKTKVVRKYKLYCPNCLNNGRRNYTTTATLKPRQQFCPYCNTLVLFRTKKKKI